MGPSGPNAEEGQQAFGPEQRKENTSFFSFLIFQIHFQIWI
jgi:hypothetical protein